jgi:hypothetical protein
MQAFLGYLVRSLVWGAIIGGASLASMLAMIDGAPFMAVALAAPPFMQ